MKIFLSWSGQRSNSVAKALGLFLEGVIPATKPWVSSLNIQAGSGWLDVLNEELKTTAFGIVCLTKGNVEAPWIAFEAGAITHAITKKRLCPYLLDLDPSDLWESSVPYLHYQAVKANRAGTEELVKSILSCVPARGKISESRLNINFEAHWTRLEKALEEAKAATEPLSKFEVLTNQIALMNTTLTVLARTSEQPGQRSSDESLLEAKVDALHRIIATMLKLHYGGGSTETTNEGP